MYGSIEPVAQERLSEWMHAAIKICMYYRDDFFKNRWYLYKYTNGMVPNVINHTGSEDAEIVLDLKYGGEYFFDTHFKYTNSPFGDVIRRKTISIIACRNTEQYWVTNKLYSIMYNSLIPLIILILIEVYFAIKRKWVEVILNLGIMIIVPITFLFAPAGFWMYYMPFYLTSYMMVMVYSLNCIDQKIEYKK